MSRVFVAFMAVCFALNSFSATQTIQADSGPNFIAVELKVGDNKLTELFPNVPVGTLLFTWDNATGWKAAQMYSTGWSHPNQVIRPWEGAVMYLPANTTVNVTLTGEVVPLPTPNYIILNALGNARIYSGFNLVSARFAKHVAEGANDPVGVYWFNKSLMQFNAYQWDSLDRSWAPVLFPATGAVWYKSGQAPVNPAGSFTETGSALYFNNYAPAYGIDERFRGVDCEPLNNGTAQVFRRLQSGATEAVGAAVAISSEFPGYIERTADLVRYVPGEASHFVRVQSGSIFSETESSTTSDFGSILPVWPQPMLIFSKKFAFRSQPQDATARPGATVELSAIFHHVNTLDPRVPLDVPYQWQKQNGSTWIDVPNATNATLRLENLDSADAGAYRLRATTCDEYFSRTATVSLIAPVVASQLQASGKVRLQVTLPVTTKAVVQSSTDLEHWTESITIDTATNEWTGEVDLEVGAKFYRVVEVP